MALGVLWNELSLNQVPRDIWENKDIYVIVKKWLNKK